MNAHVFFIVAAIFAGFAWFTFLVEGARGKTTTITFALFGLFMALAFSSGFAP